jgi:diguanylate cyclase (GGDEF)-like protein
MGVTRTNERLTDRARLIDGDILLVEDQRSLAQVAAKMLHERWGCQVLIATTMAQVKTILARGSAQFFVAVSDLHLPDAPNGEVVDLLVAAKIPVIAVTGMLDESLQDALLRKGVVDYVLKNSINAYEYIVDLVGRLHKNSRIKVLAVDDSEGFRALMQAMLAMQQLQVVTASDGIEALAVLEKQRDIKLVLVDHHMPNMDGFNFVVTVRRKLGKDRLPIIGISGMEERLMSTQFLKLGANDFISKPFTYAELACRVNQNLEMQESLEVARHASYHDYLTGMYNRRYFFEQGNRLHAEAISPGKPVLAAVMDIDYFKKINDNYGHDCGDEALKHMASLLRKHFEKGLVARVGGEEFAMILPDTSDAVQSMEKFRKLIEETIVECGGEKITFTVSIGVCRQMQPTLDQMLKQADDNLYRAKESGRNRIVVN